MVLARKYKIKLSTRRQPRFRNKWTRVCIIGLLALSVYFLFLGFIAYLAVISSQRNPNSSDNQPYFQLIVDQNGSILYPDYGSSNGTIFNSEHITVDRVGNVLFRGRDADIKRSQQIFICTKTITFRDTLLQRPAVALVSFPGSGNTWLRYLLQLATGIFTGSVYKDLALLRNGFPGENIKDGRVLAIKTHEIGSTSRAQYDKAILLIRKPSEAILSEFNRQSAGHIGAATRDNYKKNEGRYWTHFFHQKAQLWTETYLDWIENFNGPMLIIMYSQLVTNVSMELQSTLEFLQESISADVMACVLENKEGIYRRRNKLNDFNPYIQQMEAFLAAQERKVAVAIQKRIQSGVDKLQLGNGETYWRTNNNNKKSVKGETNFR